MSLKKLLSAFLVFALVFVVQSASAQDKTVTGKVTDSKDGSPVVGASVQPKGSRTGTSTRADGTFSINVGPNVTKLVITSIGFDAQEVSIEGKSSVDVSFVGTKGSNLNEVVVTGYGTRKIKDATGSIAAITPKDFNKGVISTPEQLFQGRTPGITVTPSSGEPGAASTINIRGVASLKGNSDPLYVVDGVPLDGGGTSGTSVGVEGTSTPKNPLMFINPNDIESISILKDASSAAIYGSRGANGVIIITTKTGKGKKGTFNFSSTTSMSSTASRYDLMDAPTFLTRFQATLVAAGLSPADVTAAVASTNRGATTDWQDQIFRTGVSQNFNLSWGFANKGTNLRLSGTYDKQNGIVKNSSLDRKTFRTNFSQKLAKDKLRFDVTMNLSNIKSEYAPNTNNAGYQGSLIGAALSFNPTNPIKQPNGLYFDQGDGNRNPVEMLDYFTDNDKINRVLTNISGSYMLTDGLTYKATFGYDNGKSEREAYADPRLSSGSFGGTTNVNGVDYQNGIQGNGRGTLQNLKATTTLVEHTLTYDKSFGGKHSINAVAGYSFQRYKTESVGKVAWGLNTPVVNAGDNFIKKMSNFKNNKDAFVPYYSQSDLQSYFGRVNYIFNEKYFLTATLRVDGSSKFGNNNLYGTFPAFAAKWRILKENFAQSLGNTFTELSLRLNYGKLGNSDGLPFSAADGQRTIYNGDTSLNNQANPKLKWEEATTKGVGIDFALKGNRVSGTIDYYFTKRKNIIFNDFVPGGFSASNRYLTNLPGLVTNKGLEFSLNVQAVKKTKFNWDIAYNMSFLKNVAKNVNKTINTGAVSGQGLSGAFAQIIKDDYPLYTWKMLDYQGLDKDGFAIYANGAQDAIFGSALPTFTAGLTNNFTFGRWNASMFLNTSRGFYVYNNTANALFLKGALKTAHNVTNEVGNSNENSINPGSVSSRFLEKGDFIRMSNLLVGYNFNLKKTKTIKSISATLSGQNLFLISDYSGLDPEVNVDKNIDGVASRGFDYAGYPKARTFSLGINVGF